MQESDLRKARATIEEQAKELLDLRKQVMINMMCDMKVLAGQGLTDACALACILEGCGRQEAKRP